ncbi:Maltose O-acetyltransferase [Rubripirellula amarantea]|uniref:Nodulation protein L n=2 Tax=Rubripirellula amarantea TaxID=2527999 RepID=A0A5C5WJQ3_9BACT|nr:Maltose O-acetyltransferase [Rubripirellula amarantea]
MNEKQKMLAGEPYDPNDSELAAERLKARLLLQQINLSDPGDESGRRRDFVRLFASGGDSVWLEPPFRCDYGSNIYLGRNVYFNFDCVILDVCEVRFGDCVFVGPGVHIYTASHPLDAIARRTVEFGKPVTIGNDVWIGGRAVLCPGITVGDRAVIGAGSVVTKSVLADQVVAGNPARVLRQLP